MAAAYTPSAQVKLTNVAYVRLQKNGKRFEIACYRNKILSWRNRVETDIGEVLQIDTVFSNVSKGMIASAKDILDAFGTSDSRTVCREIMDKGEMQVSEQERGAFFDSMFRDVATIVADKAINPENNRPYTLSMIQNAMRQIHYGVSLNKSAKSQVFAYELPLKALEVIRKLKDVMPIARASMLIRIVSPIDVLTTMKRVIADELGLIISKESLITEGDGVTSVSHHEIRIDPEIFRKVEEAIQVHTRGQGRLEVLQLRDSTPAPVANPKSHTTQIVEDEGKKNKNDTQTVNKTAQPSSTKKGAVRIKASALTAKQYSDNAQPVKTSRSKAAFDMLSDDSDDDSSHSNSESSDEDASKIAGKLGGVSMAWAEKSEEPSRLSRDESEEAIIEGAEADIDNQFVDDGNSSDEAEIVYGMVVKKNKKKVKKSATKDVNESVPSSVIAPAPLAEAPKKSKMLKRIEKEELKEKQKKLDVLRGRIEVDKVRADALSAAATATSDMDNRNASTTSAALTSEAGAATAKSNYVKPSGGQSCNTCGGCFGDAAAYRNHFRSEWHRHNLKRKMKNLPIVGSEEEFAALPLDQIEL